MLIQLKTKDLVTLRKKLYDKNKGICPLLGIEVPFEKTTLDHIHKLRSEECTETKGVVRNTIEFRANALEGKITNNWKRYFGADESKHPIKLPDFLRNLADYLEKGAYSEDDVYFIHPTEKATEPKISKANYNRLKKVYTSKKKFPDYPKSGKLNLVLKVLFEQYGIEPFN